MKVYEIVKFGTWSNEERKIWKGVWLKFQWGRKVKFGIWSNEEHKFFFFEKMKSIKFGRGCS